MNHTDGRLFLRKSLKCVCVKTSLLENDSVLYRVDAMGTPSVQWRVLLFACRRC